MFLSPWNDEYHTSNDETLTRWLWAIGLSNVCFEIWNVLFDLSLNVLNNDKLLNFLRRYIFVNIKAIIINYYIENYQNRFHFAIVTLI